MKRVLPLLPVLLLSGCSGVQSVLNPAGPQAARIGELWWRYLAVCVVVYVLVLSVMFLAIRTKRRSTAMIGDEPIVIPDKAKERRITFVVAGCLTITALTLVFLMVGDFTTVRALGSLGTEKNPLTVKVIGHQWWWEVQYLDATPSNIVVSANEIHIPTGRAVQVELDSVDVIHSFWVPNLHGKKDLIPGHPTTIWIKADRTGTFHGQCAEFCGFQHAHMRLQVIADAPEEFNSWLVAQRQSPSPPSSDTEKRGYAVFMSTTCVMCHSIQDSPASARVGPDLTHVASRRRIGAGSFPNTRGYLGGWVLDPQHLKPGVKMPQHSLSPDDLRALLDYLETLK